MTQGPGPRPLQDAGWILAGALLGLSVCVVVTGGTSGFDTAGVASFASVAVSALMLLTLHDRPQPVPARWPC
jgi:hypothetical protein